MAVQEINDLTLKSPAASTDEIEIQETGGSNSKKTTLADAAAAGGSVLSTLFDAHTVLAAVTDNTPAAVVVAEQRIVGRKTGGNITALTAAEVLLIINVEAGADVTDAANVNTAGAVMEADFNAQTILAATLDDTPAALTVTEQTVVGRITGGNVAALSVVQMQTLLNVENGADVTDAANVNTAGAVMEADFNAQTILAATVDDTPLPVEITEQTVVGRLTGGNIKPLSIAETNTLLGIAGLQKMWVPASEMYPETTAATAAIATAEVAAGKPEIRAFAFDGTTKEAVQFAKVLPTRWAAGTLKYKAVWSSTAADNDGVAWELAAVNLPDNTTFNTVFGTAIVVVDNAQSTANAVLISGLSAAVTVGGTPAAGDLVAFRITRDPDHASDTMAEDALLIGVELEWTSDQVNDA